MAYPILGRTFGKKVLEALGLDKKDLSCRRIVIDVPIDGVVKVYLETNQDKNTVNEQALFEVVSGLKGVEAELGNLPSDLLNPSQILARGNPATNATLEPMGDGIHYKVKSLGPLDIPSVPSGEPYPHIRLDDKYVKTAGIAKPITQEEYDKLLGRVIEERNNNQDPICIFPKDSFTFHIGHGMSFSVIGNITPSPELIEELQKTLDDWMKAQPDKQNT